VAAFDKDNTRPASWRPPETAMTNIGMPFPLVGCALQEAFWLATFQICPGDIRFGLVCVSLGLPFRSNSRPPNPRAFPQRHSRGSIFSSTILSRESFGHGNGRFL
jgi:hypothetical protein